MTTNQVTKMPTRSGSSQRFRSSYIHYPRVVHPSVAPNYHRAPKSEFTADELRQCISVQMYTPYSEKNHPFWRSVGLPTLGAPELAWLLHKTALFHTDDMRADSQHWYRKKIYMHEYISRRSRARMQTFRHVVTEKCVQFELTRFSYPFLRCCKQKTRGPGHVSAMCMCSVYMTIYTLAVVYIGEGVRLQSMRVCGCWSSFRSFFVDCGNRAE